MQLLSKEQTQLLTYVSNFELASVHLKHSCTDVHLFILLLSRQLTYLKYVTTMKKTTIFLQSFNFRVLRASIVAKFKTSAKLHTDFVYDIQKV